MWAIIYFPMSDQKHSYDRSRSCSERSQQVFLSNLFDHALEIYFPYIQWLHHKGIVIIQAFTKICVMSVHNMFMSDQTSINQLCERSKAFLCSLTLLFWALTERCFVQFIWSCPGHLFSLYPVITPQKNCKDSSIHKNMCYEHS